MEETKPLDVKMHAKQSRRMAALLRFLLACVLAASLAPVQAWAYFDRGTLGVSLGAAALTVKAGESADVSVSFTPASDEQTEGCGMPKCPQSCASTCMDELGQCRCAGTERTTYHPSAKAYSSNSGVAMAVCDAGRLRIYGRSEGRATVTVVGSLRQFNDGEATIEVTVEPGNASAADNVPKEFLDMPESADLEADDRQDYVEKTAMNRSIRFVRIGGATDAAPVLASLAGVDGETTFWSGDTLHQPDYSVTIMGQDCTEQQARSLDGVGTENFALEVGTTNEGDLMQPLSGLDEFVTVGFAEGAVLPCVATVYAKAQGAVADDADVVLYRYDDASKGFSRCDNPAQIVGGYAVFQTDTPGRYVVSTHDLVTEANRPVRADASPQPVAQDGSVGANVGVVLGVAAMLAVAVGVVVLAVRRKRSAKL